MATKCKYPHAGRTGVLLSNIKIEWQLQVGGKGKESDAEELRWMVIDDLNF